MWTLYAYFVSFEFNETRNVIVAILPDLADMLMNDDPGGVNEYGYRIWFITSVDLNTKNIVTVPLVKAVKGGLFADFYIAGLYFRILLKGNPTKGVSKYFLQEDGSIALSKLSMKAAFIKTGFL